MKRVFCLLIISFDIVTGDQELTDHAHVHTAHSINGQHNIEFDHEAILGSQDINDDFSKLSAHEAKKRLLVLLTKMDSNADKMISKQEISNWVLNNFRKLDDTEAIQKLTEVDGDGNGLVTWSEYALKVFGYTSDELQRFAADTDPTMETFNKMVSDEQVKFLVADQDDDSALNVAEYSAFLHPYNYDYMHVYEIDRTISDYDKNNDGFVSFNEYVGESKPDHEQMIVDRENFDSYDTNKDGKLDRTELRAWVLPDRRAMADEEAEHLISESDSDHNALLTYSEIIDRHDLWVGSAATDYGQELKHDPSEL